jgi:hypothetical protein
MEARANIVTSENPSAENPFEGLIPIKQVEGARSIEKGKARK